MKIAVIVNMSKKKAIDCARKTAEILIKNGAQICMLSDCKLFFERLDIKYFDDTQKLFDYCDMAVTVGGDGTIIHAAKYSAQADKPLIGVNVGRLGFAADVEPEEIGRLTKLLDGDYTVSRRILLDVEVIKKNGTSRFLAVNDAVIARGQFSKIIDLHLSLDGEEISKYRADGLLFATPTGSTAYSLSAGGPIIEPQTECILMTPVCPHSLFSRSVLFGGDSVLSVEVKIPSDCSCVLTVDGENNIDIQAEDRVVIKKSDLSLQLASLHKRNFYKLLNEKLKEREI